MKKTACVYWSVFGRVSKQKRVESGPSNFCPLFALIRRGMGFAAKMLQWKALPIILLAVGALDTMEAGTGRYQILFLFDAKSCTRHCVLRRFWEGRERLRARQRKHRLIKSKPYSGLRGCPYCVRGHFSKNTSPTSRQHLFLHREACLIGLFLTSVRVYFVTFHKHNYKRTPELKTTKNNSDPFVGLGYNTPLNCWDYCIAIIHRYVIVIHAIVILCSASHNAKRSS